MTDMKRMEQAKAIAEAIKESDYRHYGIHIMHLGEHYSEGDIAKVSRRGGLKEDGNELDTGTYTILIPDSPSIDDIIETLDRARMYGKRFVLLGCLEGKDGYDPDEICMKDAKVLMIL